MTGVRVEKRKGRLYLYSRGRVDGRQTARYFGAVSEDHAELFREPEGPTVAQVAKREAEEADREAAEVLAAGAEFDRLVDAVFRATMKAAGFTQHARGQWRAPTRGRPMAVRSDEPRPAIFTPRSTVPAHQKILDRAATGDKAVLPDVKKLLADEQYTCGWGQLGSVAEQALIQQVAGDNLMVAEAVRLKVEEYARGLLADAGPDPTYAERLTVKRVVHNWVAVHMLETKTAGYDPDTRIGLVLDRRLSQAERRLHASLKALATLKRLRTPVAPQVRVKTTGSVLVNTAPGAIPATAGS
ncbi:hypothetical protein J0H58_19580 [bacterium]|nr:hypothetical protein [bacterium]